MATLHQCERAIELHQDRLTKLPNVVGLGMARAAPGTARKGSEHVVAVYVSKKLPKSQLTDEELIPRILEVETVGKRRQVPTRVIETGVFRPEEGSDVGTEAGFGKEAL